MPFARFDTYTIRDLFGSLPRRDRAQAIAAHAQAVLVSAELLLDGHVSKAAWDSVCDDVGVSNPTRIGAALVSCGAFKRAGKGAFTIVGWEQFHSSRADVAEKRKQAAERQRRSRAQQSLGYDAGGLSRDSSHPMSQRDASPAGAAARVGATRAAAEAAAEQEQGTSTSPLEDPPAGWPEDPILDPAAAANNLGPTERQVDLLLTAFPETDRGTSRVVLPLAQALPAQTVLELAWKLRSRKRPGGVGLLVRLLTDEIRSRVATLAMNGQPGDPAFDTRTHIERLRQDNPDAYLTALAPTLTETDIDTYLAQHVTDPDERIRLTDLAADLRRGTINP